MTDDRFIDWAWAIVIAASAISATVLFTAVALTEIRDTPARVAETRTCNDRP